MLDYTRTESDRLLPLYYTWCKSQKIAYLQTESRRLNRHMVAIRKHMDSAGLPKAHLELSLSVLSDDAIDSSDRCNHDIARFDLCFLFFSFFWCRMPIQEHKIVAQECCVPVHSFLFSWLQLYPGFVAVFRHCRLIITSYRVLCCSLATTHPTSNTSRFACFNIANESWTLYSCTHAIVHESCAHLLTHLCAIFLCLWCLVRDLLTWCRCFDFHHICELPRVGCIDA
jgi:hypothetical protein